MLTIDINTSLQEAAKKMIKHHYRRLVMVDPEQPDAMPPGVISSFDIVAEMSAPGSVRQQG